jgi:hypothetical protein
MMESITHHLQVQVLGDLLVNLKPMRVDEKKKQLLIEITFLLLDYEKKAGLDLMRVVKCVTLWATNEAPPLKHRKLQ